MNQLKKNLITLLLTILLMISLADMVTARVPNFPQPVENLTGEDKILADNALQFLSNVANVNTSSYRIDVRIANEAPGVRSGKTLHFNLTSSAGILDVIAEFTNGELFWSSIFSIKGSSALNQPVSSNVLNTAKDTLASLQEFSARDYLPTFQSMLNSVPELQDSKTSNLNYTQKITVSGNIVRMIWEPFANGLSNPQNNLFLEFKNGNLEYYADYLGMYSIGSSDIKISKSQAIQIAVDHAQTFSYTQDKKNVSEFTVLDSLVIADISLQNRGNNTLYPHWSIMLPLDKEYPGGVTAFRVNIWADTGEISYFTPIGFYGTPNPVPSSEPQQTVTPTPQAATDNNPAAVSNTLIIGGIALLAAIVGIAGHVFYRRKR